MDALSLEAFRFALDNTVDAFISLYEEGTVHRIREQFPS